MGRKRKRSRTEAWTEDRRLEMADRQGAYLPSPEEIRRMTLVIQARWGPTERLKRSMFKPVPACIPEYGSLPRKKHGNKSPEN